MRRYGDSYVQVDISPVANEWVQSGLLAEQMSEIGYEAFEERVDSFRAYIPESSYDQKSLAELLDTLLGKDPSRNISHLSIAARNWNAEWEASFQPIVVEEGERRILIRAPFHNTDTQADIDLQIAPKMAFGTGHHATTEGMIRLMLRVANDPALTLDFGCGTGILAMLARKLWRKRVLGIDIDPVAIESAKENGADNHLSEIEWLCGGGESIPACDFDLILANLTFNLLRELTSTFASHLASEGSLLVSGFFASELAEMDKIMRSWGLLRTDTYSNQQSDWIAIAYRNQDR